MRNGKVAARPSGFPDWLKVRIGAGEEEGELMTWLNGLPGAQAPFSPFGHAQSNLVKPGQAWSSLVKAKTGVWPSNLDRVTKFRNLPKMT
jgi:hypothetical protein